MPFDISTEAYIERITARLNEGRPESLIYAALELRCAVEGRLKEYLDPLDHIPNAQKKEWSVVKLGKNVKNAFQIGDRIASFTIVLDNPAEEIELRYIPVSPRLQAIANRVGDWLHFPGEKAIDEAWSEELARQVNEGLAWLKFANSGDLLGVPLQNKRTKQTSIKINIQFGDPRLERLKRLQQGDEHVVKVNYLDLPEAAPAA